MEESILEKKRKIVLFDEGTDGMEMLYIDDDGCLQIPKKQKDEIVRLDSSITEKRVRGLIKENNRKYK
jgi:hypothetical protein